MPISFIDEEEKLVFEYQDAKIIYRRVPKQTLKTFIKQCTRKGIIDWAEVSDKTMQYAIIDWDGFVHKGNPVPFSVEFIEKMPMAVQNAFIEQVMDDDQYEGEVEKN